MVALIPGQRRRPRRAAISPWRRPRDPVVLIGSFATGHGAPLARFGYACYQSTFPGDVDFHYGHDDPATHWSWVQPGPDDAWAGRRTHRFRLRFTLSRAPRTDLALIVALADRHPTRAGAAAVMVNGRRCDSLLFVDGEFTSHATDVPGHGAGPLVVERGLPAAVFVHGENVVDIVKDQGSWIAYSAVGIFAP